MARRQKTAAETADDKSKDSAKSEQSGPSAKPEAAKTEQTGPSATPEAARKPAEAASEATIAQPGAQELPAIEPPAARAEPWPDATPQPMKPVQSAAPAQSAEPTEPVHVSRTPTVAMPTIADPGKPPEMPQSVAPPPLALGSVEDPTHMPGPKDVPSGSPGDPAPAPGRVPPGDSRSLRRGNDFALVYRVGTCVISRTGVVGTRGQWRVVEYPTSASASNSYAKECSRFVSEGFSDYRE